MFFPKNAKNNNFHFNWISNHAFLMFANEKKTRNFFDPKIKCSNRVIRGVARNLTNVKRNTLICAYFQCKRQLNLIGCLIFAGNAQWASFCQANECFKEISSAHQPCNVYPEIKSISATTSLTVMYVHCALYNLIPFS